MAPLWAVGVDQSAKRVRVAERLVGIELNPGPPWDPAAAPPTARALLRFIALRLRRVERLSSARIAMVLDVSQPTVKRWLSTYKGAQSAGDCEDLPRSGRPSVLGPSEMEAAERAVEGLDEKSQSYPANSPTRRRVQQSIDEQTGTHVSVWTVGRAMHELELVYRRLRPVPALSNAQMERRLAFAQEYSDADWRYMLFADEKTFELSHCEGRAWVHVGVEPVAPHQAHVAKIHCFAGVGHFFCAPPFLFRQTLDGVVLRDILQERLPPTAAADTTAEARRAWVLVHDNDPKYTAHDTQVLLDVLAPDRIRDWPANSPDLNPIENVWADLQQLVDRRRPQTAEELEVAILNAWSELDFDRFRRYIDSMPQRLQEVQRNHGGNTHY
jgi:transposase